MTQIIKNGGRAAVINSNPNDTSFFWVNLYVNARNEDMSDWSITHTRNTFKTLSGATKWAKKVVA